MANVSVYNMEGKEVGRIDLNDAVFGVEINEHLVHMAVVQQLANKTSGNAESKNPFGSFRRREKTLEAERNRPCKAGFYKGAPVERRRRCFCPGAKGLFL